MMKKFTVVLVVLAMTCLSSMALAADVTLGGSVQLRSRDFQTLSLDKTVHTANQVDTQERIMIDVNVKSEGAAGKISLWNDFQTWGGNSGGFENTQGVGFGKSGTDGSAFGFREAWLLFNVPGVPVTVKAGHQLLQLGGGWFFRSMHFGSDAWVAFNDTGANHLGFVNVKIAEGASAKADDDIDAYVIVDTYKINDTNKIGVDLTMANDRGNGLGFNTAGYDTKAQNLGINYNGKLGPVNLFAQVDMQSGKAKGATEDRKLKGNEVVIQGKVPMDAVTINFTLARGSGKKAGDTSVDYKQFVNFMDVDPHYTFLYEYKIATAAGKKNTGFSNTTAISAGAMLAATKSVSVGLDVWYLQATEKCVSVKDPTAYSKDAGTEVDAKINWKISDNLAWNWDLGYYKPGAAIGKDAATGIMGVLAYKF